MVKKNQHENHHCPHHQDGEGSQNVYVLAGEPLALRVARGC